MKILVTSNEDDITKIKTMRTKLESRIESQHNTQIELLSSLQTIIPNIVTSVDQSLKIISLFNNRPFSPTPLPPPNPSFKNRDLKQKTTLNNKPTTLNDECLSVKLSDDSEKFMVDESGNPLMVVRSIVAVCLLQRVPFLSIDSSTVLRKLENDQSVTVVEKAALRGLGGESGAILAVEMALRSMAQDNGGVELEEFVVDGKSSVMVLGIDRSRLSKELPESAQLPNFSSKAATQSQNVNTNSGEANMGCYGPGVQVSRPMQDMWSGHGESPHVSGLPPLFPGSGPLGLMIGPRGVAPRLVGTPGMPRGMNIPRPQFGNVPMNGPNDVVAQRVKSEEDALKDCEDLVNKKSYKQLKQLEIAKELSDLIHRPTALENAEADKFKTKGGYQVKEYCTRLTKEDCRHKSGSYIACEKVHFRRIVALHTDINLGDCSFLDTCRHMKTCKFVHYELDSTPDAPSMISGVSPKKPLKPQRAEYCSQQELGEAQWINSDIRNFRMDILGQFGVIMADPPWDIHMELPYGTMGDDEMRTLNVQSLQTDGLIFLWVTGRAMELGRECLELWGYKRVEEIIWVKTNQLQRIIRTGRTGHWLNHSKEHCLVGIKGNPEGNRNIDTDVIVAEVRETSRKPDEVDVPIVGEDKSEDEKLELFARMHNTMSGWMSLGNQLPGVRLVDDGLRARFKAAYPEVAVEPASPRVSAMETDSNPAQARTPFTEGIATDTTFASDNKPIPMEVDMAC